MLNVGILALQGDWSAHGQAVSVLSHRPRLVKAAEHLAGVDALVLPGGESSTMLKFLREEGLFDPLAAFCRSGRPVLGTCAGAILLAHRVSSPEQPALDVLDVDIERNAYGRQVDSFVATLDDGAEGLRGMEGVFIRAPRLRRVGPGVDVLLRHEQEPVLVRQGPVWAATFHPELSSDTRLLRAVLESGTA